SDIDGGLRFQRIAHPDVFDGCDLGGRFWGAVHRITHARLEASDVEQIYVTRRKLQRLVLRMLETQHDLAARQESGMYGELEKTGGIGLCRLGFCTVRSSYGHIRNGSLFLRIVFGAKNRAGKHNWPRSRTPGFDANGCTCNDCADCNPGKNHLL